MNGLLKCYWRSFVVFFALLSSIWRTTPTTTTSPERFSLFVRTSSVEEYPIAYTSSICTPFKTNRSLSGSKVILLLQQCWLNNDSNWLCISFKSQVTIKHNKMIHQIKRPLSSTVPRLIRIGSCFYFFPRFLHSFLLDGWRALLPSSILHVVFAS